MQPELQTVNTGYGSVAVPSDSQKVLRNTYMLLALTMVPTVAGAWIGMPDRARHHGQPDHHGARHAGRGDRPAVRHRAPPQQRHRRRPAAADDGPAGRWLGPLLNVALPMSNGMQLVGYAAVGTGVIFFGMGAIAVDDQARLQLHGQVPVRRHDRAADRDGRQHVPADPGARADDLDAGDRGVLAVPAARPDAHHAAAARPTT